ncbi:MAG: flagellar motor protein MotB, partial [Maribacter sp.]|uniref:flagellar motor protein MotB n=1 Tax=Maribacter sp. TaxID=1897614 RepID=UPI003C7742DC
MKKLLLIIFVLGVLPTLFAQDELKRADTYFERTFYSDAIPLYEQLLPRNKSSKLIKNLADSYYHTFNMKAAARWYTYLAANYGDKVGEDYQFKLYQSLKATGAYDEAHQVLLDFYTQQNQNDKVDQLNNALVYLENVSAIGPRFDIENLLINTPNSEFGAAVLDSNLVYTATRKNSGKIYRWNNLNYLDIYSHPLPKLAMGDSLSVPFSKTVNTKMHEGSFAITNDRKTLYFTRNGTKRTDSEKIKNLKIYKAEWGEDDWDNIVELPFNSDVFSTEHPVLNSDESRLYFASDREGGFGSFDLYYVDIQSDERYGNPINLGKEINTDKKEQFPFLDDQDNLYFASNGHPGYGLLDIFLTKYQNGSYEKPDNLGLPINSGYDDFSMWLYPNGKTGFFASNRPGGKGNDDIYAFTETKPLLIEDCNQFIVGIVTDKSTQMPIAEGKIQLVDAEGTLISDLMTGRDGSFKFDIACTSSYKINGSKAGYEDNSKAILSSKERNMTHDGSLALFSLQEKENQRLAVEEKQKNARLLQEQKAQETQLIAETKAKEEAKKQRDEKIKDVIQKEEAIVREKERTIIQTEEIH